MRLRQTKRPRDLYPPATWLRRLTSRVAYGEFVPDLGRPLPGKTSLETERDYNGRGYFAGMRNAQYRDHAGGAGTYYYMGNGDPKAEGTLVMIDVDVQKKGGRGSPAGAAAFAGYLKRHYFPGLYYEPSTGGRGVHAYLVLAKRGLYATTVNEVLKAFEGWLSRRAAGFDVEMVEVKGSCPVLTFDPAGGRRVADVKYGTLAKLPRRLDDPAAFEALKGTTVLGPQEVLQLPEVDYPCPDRDDDARAGELLAFKKKIIRSGSVSGRHVSEEDLACLPRFRSIAKKYAGAAKLRAGRHVVLEEDFAIAFLLLKFFKQHPNEDGSLPTARVRKLWEALHDSGDVERPWNHHRWKVIRDSMSAWGLLDWADDRYEPGHYEGDEWKKGRACKFEVTEEFFRILEEGGGPFVDTVVSTDPFFLRPVLVWNLNRPERDKVDRFIRRAEGQLEYRLAA